MAKLGYTFYPKDWGNSDAVFELNLSERGLYRELIDLAMTSDNKVDIKIDLWSRKYGASHLELTDILEKLSALDLVEIDGSNLFIPSCESRLKLVRGGKKGGETSKPTAEHIIKPEVKPLDKPTLKPEVNQIEKETKSKLNINNTLMSEIKISDDKDSVLFKDSILVDYYNIAEKFRLLFIKNCKDRGAPTTDQDNAKFKAYVDPIRLILEKDNVSKEQLREVYQYLNHDKGDFWKSNVLSTVTLRKQLTKIILKKNEPTKKPSYK